MIAETLLSCVFGGPPGIQTPNLVILAQVARGEHEGREKHWERMRPGYESIPSVTQLLTSTDAQSRGVRHGNAATPPAGVAALQVI